MSSIKVSSTAATHKAEMLQMAEPAYWAWSFEGPFGPGEGQGRETGIVRGQDLRHAAAQVLTAVLPSGMLFGHARSIPPEVIDLVSANFDTKATVCTDGRTLKLQLVTCPVEARHPGDVVGCGALLSSGPDEEGMFDCKCGVFFNPHTAY